jgi:proline iminopeptidase
MQRRIRYQDIPLNKEGMLDVGGGHQIYWEESGNPKGIPALFVHGGPGSNTEPAHRGYFNPKKYRIILFDQRGAGKSRPHAELKNNSTWDLVSDMEKLRNFLGIDQWLVFGGSWGSTLSLTYAICHPDKVRALVLRGIFLCRKSEINWFYQGGAHHIFPDEWDRYLATIPENERHDMLSAYYKRLTSDNKDVRMQAAKSWSRWEGATIRLIPDLEQIEKFTLDDHALAISRIETHYFVNKAFFESDNWILENVSKISQIPTVIVHGRYDVVCPVENAWALHKKLPNAKLEIVADAGHAAAEPGIVDALLRATDDL